MGFSMTELFDFLAALSAAAESHEGTYGAVPCDVLEQELADELGWSMGRVQDAITLHVLAPRESFLPAPPGFTNTELWPWRFNRNLSYMRRPLLRRPSSGGDEYVWGLRQPERAGRYLFDLIFTERLRARSAPMKNLMTRLRQHETKAFVSRVADVLRASGIPVDTNVKKVAGERMRRANNQDIADVDVLAADPQSLVIYAFECKDLAGARTPAELHNELSQTFSGDTTRGSAALRQLERVAWLRDRVPQTLLHLGISSTSTTWTIEGAIVTDIHVLSPYVAECPLPVTAFSEFQLRFAGS
jgi:hypothetical protein